jgi:hypothetical protein
VDLASNRTNPMQLEKKSMELEGRINSAMNLPEILQFLGMGKMTGTLTVVSGDYAATLSIRQGRLINTTSLGRPRRLGQMLVNRGLVERTAIEEALTYQQNYSPGAPLGRILVHQGYVTMEQLRQAIRLQMEEELWDLFGLRDGSFKFEHGSEELVGSDALVELEIEPLILEGTRRLDEWARIVKNIANDRAIPSVIQIPDSDEREMMNFSEAEWRVLSLINGYFDVGCIASRSGMGKFETFRVMNSFLASGLVTMSLPKEPAPESVRLDANADRLMPASPTDEKEKTHGGSSARLAGLFTRWREGDSGGFVPPDDSAAKPRGALSFASPVSFICALSNGVADELTRNPDFIVDPRDERLAEGYWRTILMEFPRADLVKATKNSLDARPFDRYMESVGVVGPMASIYGDTMEALNRYLRTMYLLAVQRLGGKVAKRVFATYLEDYKQRSKIANSENFFFNEYAARALK